MDFLRPATLDEALAMKAETPDAVPIAGGTDIMVELNFDKRRPPALLDLSGIATLGEWRADNGHIRLGATVPY
ncbi:MAG TPA: FAD binding domain-containing protein, partial [Actinophytocola sp.]|nr:FAD binding domain-containing protein [Actinophytocola sp.]